MKTEVRIDKWIWAMRIFKTRTVATDSCKKGRVMLRTPGGDVVAKPSRMIKVGDVVLVRKPPVTYSFRVKALTENRLGARLAPEYMENITPKEQYDKREGRDLAAFTDQIYMDSSVDDFDDDSDNNDFDFDESDFND